MWPGLYTDYRRDSLEWNSTIETQNLIEFEPVDDTIEGEEDERMKHILLSSDTDEETQEEETQSDLYDMNWPPFDTYETDQIDITQRTCQHQLHVHESASEDDPFGYMNEDQMLPSTDATEGDASTFHGNFSGEFTSMAADLATDNCVTKQLERQTTDGENMGNEILQVEGHIHTPLAESETQSSRPMTGLDVMKQMNAGEFISAANDTKEQEEQAEQTSKVDQHQETRGSRSSGRSSSPLDSDTDSSSLEEHKSNAFRSIKQTVVWGAKRVTGAVCGAVAGLLSPHQEAQTEPKQEPELERTYPSYQSHLHTMVTSHGLPSPVSKLVIEYTGALQWITEGCPWQSMKNSAAEKAKNESRWGPRHRTTSFFDVLTIQVVSSRHDWTTGWNHPPDTVRLVFLDGRLMTCNFDAVNEERHKHARNGKAFEEKQKKHWTFGQGMNARKEEMGRLQRKEEEHENEQNFVIGLGLLPPLFSGVPLFVRPLLQGMWHSNIQTADSPAISITDQLLDQEFLYFQESLGTIQFVGPNVCFCIFKLHSHDEEDSSQVDRYQNCGPGKTATFEKMNFTWTTTTHM